MYKNIHNSKVSFGVFEITAPEKLFLNFQVYLALQYLLTRLSHLLFKIQRQIKKEVKISETFRNGFESPKSVPKIYNLLESISLLTKVSPRNNTACNCKILSLK